MDIAADDSFLLLAQGNATASQGVIQRLSLTTGKITAIPYPLGYSEAGAWDELQPGSYIFMDVDYAKNEWAAPLPRFEHALFVLATVMSRPAADRAIVDAGLKASSVDSGLPLVWQREGLVYRGASDEHGAIEIAAGAQAPSLGEKLYLVPGHCDPTVNLYDWYVCVRNRQVESVWSVTARGALN